MPYSTGLVSVSFRSLTPVALAQLTAQARLKAIEWGGDVHVPHGDTQRAREVATITRDAGLRVAAYGSYYRLGVSEHESLPFGAVLETALELGAPSIRVWAGNTASAKTAESVRHQIIEDALRCAEKAAKAGVKVALEYHANTLTDCDASAVRLLQEAPHPNLYTLWQPINGETLQNNLTALRHVLPRLLNLHVFHWTKPADTIIRHPLAEGRTLWEHYFKLANPADAERYCLLEFVPNDDPKQLLADAETLHDLIAPY